jgi:hypothetical protein
MPSPSRCGGDIAAGDRSSRISRFDLRRLAQFRPLLDVVDQGEQLPLTIDLALALIAASHASKIGASFSTASLAGKENECRTLDRWL